VSSLLPDIAWAIGAGLVAAGFFSAIGVIGGTDETGTIVPPTLLIILLGIPPPAGSRTCTPCSPPGSSWFSA